MKKILLYILLTIAVGVACGQSYHVGDLFTAPDGSKGIVYYIHPDGSGGWVVALRDASTGCPWGSSSVDIESLPNQAIYGTYPQLLNDTAGYASTAVIRAEQNSDPQYAAGVVDFDNGWILPSPAQLSMLCGQLPYVASALTAAGGTNMAGAMYWCSAERSAGNAWCVSFGIGNYIGYFSYASKTTSYRVRAVRSFTYRTGPSLSYLWNTGDTSATVTVTPTETTTYTVTVSSSAGCDGVVTHTIAVKPPDSMEFAQTVCESYEWNGQFYTESGDYTQTFVNQYGCDSVVTLHLMVNRGTHHVTDTAVCDSYTWTHGTGDTYTESGTYTFSYTNADGCPSADTLHLTVNHPQHQSETVIGYDSVAWNGTMYIESGDYTYSYTDENGCDAMDTLHLTLYHSTSGEITVIACDSFIWNDSIYTVSGDYVQILSDIHGADSTMTLHLTVNHSVYELVEATACDSYEWNGQVYTESGDYPQTFANQDGCDSIVTLHLTVNHGTHNVTDTAVCESYTWTGGTGDTYTESGTYTFSYTNAAGCASTDTLHLAVHHAVYELVETTACESYEWNGQFYTESGDYTQMLTDQYGCDSVVTLHLTVNPNYVASDEMTVCSSELPYEWNGVLFIEAGSQNVTLIASNGCDSFVTMTLSVIFAPETEEYVTICDSELPYTYGDTVFEVGTPQLSVVSFYYPTSTGCDSVVTLNLTVLPAAHGTIDTSVVENSLPFVFNGESYSEEGSYTQYFTSSVGCDSVLTINLNIHHNVTVEVETTVCENELPYRWNGVTFTEAGTQSVTLISSVGGDSTVVMTVYTIDNSLEVVMLTDDPCENFEAELLAQTALSHFIWSTGEYTPQISVYHSGTYYVTASDGGCVATGKIFVPECDFQLYLPNAITASDNNGINDYFFISQYSQRQIKDFEIIIYNRWGQMVFRSEDKNFRWHGDSNGKIMTNTTYTYVIYCTNYNGKEFILKGIVTVF